MSRLLDRVRTGKVRPLPGDLAYQKEHRRVMQEFGREIDGAVCIVADNVAEYLFAGSEKEFWSPEEFSNVAPPFPVVWVEHARPSVIRSEEYGELHTDLYPERVGYLLRAEEPLLRVDRPDRLTRGEKNAQVIAAWQRDVIRMAMHGHDQGLLGLVEGLIAAAVQGATIPWQERTVNLGALDLRWVVDGTLFLELDGHVMGPEYLYRYVVASDGSLPFSPLIGKWTGDVESAVEALVMRGSASHLYVPLLALTFLNCRNVSLEEHVPPEKLSRAHRRRHGQALVKYHTIHVRPMTRRKGGGEATGSGAAMPLHKVRGHFKTYGPEAPLFGRHVGTWFWADRLVGDLDAGLVVSDYRVDVPVERMAA